MSSMGLTPSLAGFQTFIQNVMGISSSILSPTDPVVAMAYNVALDIVNDDLAGINSDVYTLAVYNLAGDNLLNYAQDASGAPIYKNGLPFFQYVRQTYNLAGFVGGVISSSGDEGTNQSMVVPEAMKMFTMANLQQLKTPYGRQYMAFAQSYGPSVWGVS